MSKSYRLEEVQEHSTTEDLWIVIHNRVYDVAKYLDDHPGGAAVLLEVAGADATTEFEEAGHSIEATNSLKDLYIGELNAEVHHSTNSAGEQHRDAVEVYRPKFEHISQKTVVIPVGETKKGHPIANVLGAGGLLGVLGVMTHRGYQNYLPLSYGAKVMHSLPSFGPRINWHSSGNFWIGFGVAAVGGAFASIGALILFSSKLDVNAEFTHYVSHRAALPDRTVHATTKKAVAQVSGNTTVAVLDRKSWKPFKLVRKVEVAPNVYRMFFALPRPIHSIGLPTGQHIALQATIKGKSVSRSYTPVSNNSDLGRIELLIKVYNDGLMTKYLEGMEIGDTIDIRGPKGTMEYSTRYARHIGMIAGGTGITPMYQLIRAICEDTSDKTKVSLIYANNTEDDILLLDELQGFAKQCPDKLSIHYVLSTPPPGWTGSKGYVTTDLIKKHLPAAAQDVKVLLCGPPPMINAMKANLAGLGFKAPSAMSKAADQVFLF